MRIIEVPSNPVAPPLSAATFQFEVNGTGSTCTSTFQAVGSLDDRTALPPEGVGGAWSNIGTATTITCSTPGITPAVAIVTTTTLYCKYGVIISTLSGTGAAASARLLA